MAASALSRLSTLVTIEQYLNTSYRPDVEFLDGELREKPVVQWIHVRLQSLLCSWFDQHEDEWQIIGGPEARTRVSATRVRLPDVVMIPAGPAPQMLVDPPLIVIEILSPGDSMSEMEARMQDYEAMGVGNLWLIDPERRVGRVYRSSAWTEVTRFTVENSPIYVDLGALFVRLDRYATQPQ